jgi:preprotein translocase subunit SecG
MSNTSENMIDPNESKEVSILKRNLRLLRRIILGKTPPPLYLKVICWIFLAWSLAMIIAFMFMSLTFKIGNSFTDAQSNLDALTPKYFFTYALVHCVALIGVILMYRKKITGFYIFGVATMLMPFWEFAIKRTFDFNLYIFLFSLVSVGLFALHFYVFAPKKKKELAADSAEGQQ